MIVSPLFASLFFTLSPSLDFSQKIEIDTIPPFLEPTPAYFMEEKALCAAHKEYEKSLKSGAIDLTGDYYLIFRYRDAAHIPYWNRYISDNPGNPLLKVWFINALSQMGEPRNLKFICSYNHSDNPIVRECAANAYGFLAPKDSIPALKKWLSAEKNGFVYTTIEASINAISAGGYKSRVPYLPVYYPEKPPKLRFLYNRKVNDDPAMRYEEVDSTDASIRSHGCIFPHQQYLWKLRNAPKRGFFGSKRNSIYHIGIDSGWLLEGLPVHSISDGIVKQLSHNLSWGCLVVIQSTTRGGDSMCVIYGHLSPYNTIQPGDTVRAGDKIGQIGNSVTPDNGGYWAHLHLGIEKKPFSRAKISGYDFDTLSYENPITFITSNDLRSRE